MKTETEVKRKLIVEFEEEDAIWLREYLQNFVGPPDSEQPEYREKREFLFNRLSEFLKVSQPQVNFFYRIKE